MNADERRAIEAECTRMVNHFIWCLDTHNAEEGVPMFTIDCTFGHAGGTVYEGLDGMREVFATSAADRKPMAHPCSNIVVDVLDADHAESKALGQVYYHQGPFDPAAPPPIFPLTIVRFDTRFRRTDEGWRISKWFTHHDFRADEA